MPKAARQPQVPAIPAFRGGDAQCRTMGTNRLFFEAGHKERRVHTD